MLVSNVVKRNATRVVRFPAKQSYGRRLFSTSPGSQPSVDAVFKYQISVAFQPKDREDSNIFLKRKKSTALLSPTGEDNFLVAKKDDSNVACGVADGVGGWAERGFDSSAISRELCQFIAKGYLDKQISLKHATPKELLHYAYQQVLASDDVKVGGTTACIGVFDGAGLLKVANLGDSWVGVFRDFNLVHESKIQTLDFNTPKQLAKIPASIFNEARKQGTSFIMSQPKEADSYEFQLQKNDLILFATDGVTDNAHYEDIQLYLRDQFAKDPVPSLDVITKDLVKSIVTVSKDPNFPSMFSQELSALTGQKYLGGKEDDITIVLVKVV